MSVKQKNKLIPKLRFPEFMDSGEWEIKPLSDLLDYERPDKYIVKSTNYSNEGIPVLTANKSFVLGYTKENFGIYDNLPAIIFDDFTVDNKYVDFPFKVKSSAIKILTAKKDDNLRFVYELMSQIKFDAIQHKRYYISQYQTLNVPTPNIPEQQKIADFLSNLDELIEAHKQKLELLKQHKKGLMQNLFPQEGEKVPKLRFPEFKDSGEWVEKKLGEIGEPMMCKRIFKDQTSHNSENGIPFYKIGTFGKKADSFISVELYNEFKSKYNFPNKGDILISASGTIGRLVKYDGLPAYFQDSNIVWIGHNEKQIFNNFLFYCYSKLNWQTSDGGVIKRLYNSDLKNITIIFPENKKEQQKIASCLSSIDEIITAETEKIEQLERHKKGLMQGLFPIVNE